MRKNIVLTLISSLLLTACAESALVQTEFALGTNCSVTLFTKHTRTAQKTFPKIFARIAEIEALMSANRDDSELSKINEYAGLNPVSVSPDVYRIIEKSVAYAELSEGAFDPAIGALVKLWGIHTDFARVPSQSEIDTALPLVNYKDIQLDPQKQSVFLMKSGMKLDLGGIAKGFAADESTAIIRKAAISRAIIDFGGNIVVVGEKAGKAMWRVGVRNPVAGEVGTIGFFAVDRDKTLVTSGVYERFLEIDGARWHHLLSAKTGKPVENGVLSVTIAANSSLTADALSTTAFMLGYEKGAELLATQQDVSAVFIFADQSVKTVPQNLSNFTLTNKDFFLKP